MFNKAQNILILLCVVSCIYVIRDNNTSPMNFLQRQAARFLQEVKPSASLCDGVDFENEVTDSDRARADDFRSSLSSIRKGNPFIEFIEGPLPSDDFAKDYMVPVIKYTIPWIVFFAISIIACVTYLSFWCCCRHSKSDRFKKVLLILSMIFLVCVIGASIAGLAVSRGIHKGGHRTICRVALLLEDLAYGDSTDKFIGIRSAAERVTTVLDNFDSTINNTPEIDNNFAEMNARLQPALAAAQNMYTDNADRVVSRPDGGVYTPSYIQTLSDTTGAIQAEMGGKRLLVEGSVIAVNGAITQIRENQAGYVETLRSGKEFAQVTIDSVNDVLAKVEKFGNNVGSRTVNVINGALLGIFITKLLIAIFAICMIIFVAKGVRSFNKFIHFSWCTLGFIVILTWALTAVVYPFIVVMFEGCEVADKVISDPVFFDKAFNKFVSSSDSNTEKTREVIRQCLFGDGDLLAVFGIQGKVDMFDPIFKVLDETKQQVPDVSIPENQQLIQSYKDGLVTDADEALQDLSTLNTFIADNLRQCPQIQDEWTFNSAQCVADFKTVFTSNDAADFNMGKPTCIGFNVWEDKNINERYSENTLPPDNCGATDEYLSSYVGKFAQSRKEVREIFVSLENSLDTVAVANTAFMDSVNQANKRFDPVRESTLTMYNALANKDTGLLANTNCLFIKESVHNLHDSLCVETLSSLYQTVAVIIVLSFMGLFATLFVFCLTRKYGAPKKEGRQDAAEPYKDVKP